MEFKVRASDWLAYAEGVGDNNPVHRDRRFVLDNDALKKLGIEDIIAPGMWLASHIQGEGSIASIKSIRFPKSVYDGDILSVTQKGNDYLIYRGSDIVCELRGVIYGDFANGTPRALKGVQHRYEMEITGDGLRDYWQSLGGDLGVMPDMYLASLSAPALLDYGEKRGLTGLHASQTFIKYAPFSKGHLSVLMGDLKTKEGKEGTIHRIDKIFIQNDNIIATGRATIGSFAA